MENAKERLCAILFFRNREKSTFEKLTDELISKSNISFENNLNEEKLTILEKTILRQTRLITEKLNLNNVTRTKAYFEFFKQYPEIHWAFLGHMVSRNGGWNMTDLKGEFLTRLLSKKEQNTFFSFLERGNWLIFQDAYPQFLLYQESLKWNKPFFYLFPYLNISTFMESIWNYFWQHHNTYILTMGLVINEQSYLEKRVIQNKQYQKEVLNTFEFKLQDLLSFNQILFPYGNKNLAGQTLHQFSSLEERILLGKRLYSILFKNNNFLRQVYEWAHKHPHTGSRKDFWPHLFNNVNEGTPGFPYQLRLKSCELRKGARKLYSPTLENAWKNVTQKEAEKGDWYNDPRVTDYLIDDDEIYDGEITNEYCKTLERLELATLAKKAIFIRD